MTRQSSHIDSQFDAPGASVDDTDHPLRGWWVYALAIGGVTIWYLIGHMLFKMIWGKQDPKPSACRGTAHLNNR